MFRGKSDIDKHVFGLLYRAKDEQERNLRCFHIAKLYYKIQDYESVQRYINMYLSTRDDSAVGHKLLGQALEGLGHKEKAISAYTKSLKLEPDQSDLLNKVCELLCDKGVEFDPALARYWCERASLLFPHSLPVVMLKEKLLTSDSSLSSKDLEELLHAELKTKPTDVTVRIKLLKMYAESGRLEMAVNHALEVEARQAHVNCFAWYQCLNNIFKAYNRDHYAKCSSDFYVQWLTALDRMCLLSVTENMSHSCDLSESTDCIYSLDQAINSATQCLSKSEKFGDFLKLMSTQLAYLLGILLLKRAKKENSQWKETKRLVGPLFVIASTIPLKQDIIMKETLQKIFNFWVQQVYCRQVQAGNLLLCLVKENNSEKMFLDKVNHFTAGDWRRQIFERVYITVGDRKSSTSHFMNGAEFSKFSLKIPSSSALKPATFVTSFENIYFGSLHHLVWLGLRAIKKTSILEMKLHSFRSTCFKSLQFTISNLNNIGVETINQLDVDAFLYITVFCTASILEEHKTNGYSNEDRPKILPADISSPLCTVEQAKWWSNLCTIVKGGASLHGSSSESLSDMRFSLLRGLEVVRGEGLSPILIVALARTFSARGSASSIAEESEGCIARALHLWQIAYPMLERLASSKSYFTSPKMNSLFECPMKLISPQEAKILFEEAKFFIGCHYLKTGQYEKAVDELKGIKSPHAIFNLAIVYQKWAEQQIDGLKGEEITSEIRCRHVVLATQARDYLFEAKSMIKNDPKSPLRNEIEEQIAEVEDLLARIEPENGISDRDVNGTSDASPSYESGGTDLMNLITTANQRSTRHQTSTPHRTHEQKVMRFNMSELIELLSVHQSTNQLKMQQVLEQIRLVTEKIDCVTSEQRTQRSMVEGLSSRLNSFETEIKSSLSDIKKDVKRPELCNMFDDDDYTDEMLPYPGYPQYYAPAQRVVQNTAPPPAVPYVNHQYFSPRIDPLCQSFYSQQGALPFSEGQQLPDFLRQQKVNQPLLHSIPQAIPPTLNLAPGVPGPSRVPTASSLPSNVLLTTADSISSVTQTVPPQLSVNIPNSRRLGDNSTNVPHNFQIPLPPQPKPVLNIEERQIEEETPPPTYDPLPDYKPLFPLPDEIEVHTGEEEEDVLFEKRAKLFRFIDKMWKERGVGNLKILKSKTNGKVRIVMRRDQVHKICANHFLTPDMELQPKANTESAWIWVANDFAEEKMQPEKFCAKFKTTEDSEEFKQAFDKAKDELSEKDTSLLEKSNGSQNESIKPVVESGFKFLTKTDPKPNTDPKSFSQTEPKNLFQSVPKSTESKSLLSMPAFSFNVAATTSSFPASSSFNFTPSFAPTNQPQLATDGKSKDISSLTPISQSPVQPTKVGGFTFSLAPPKLKAPESSKEEVTNTVKEPSPFAKFNLGLSTDIPKSSFSALSSLNDQSSTDFPNPFAISKSTKSSVQSSSQGKIVDDLKGAAADSTNEKRDVPESPLSKEEGDDNFVPTATFEPVIPLPNLITVKTGEENEQVVFEERAQLYRYCRETKQWKERGTGQMKILKHPDTGSYRLLMRREQVLKVCCNHRITKDITIKPLSSSDRTFSWAARDHSEEPPTDEMFSLRFKKPEQAHQFKEAFEKAQNSVQSVPDIPKLSNKPPLSTLVKKPPGSWDCKSCYVQNNADAGRCVACSEPRVKDGSAPIQTTSQRNNEDTTQKSLSELLKPKPGSWECGDCYLRNDAEIEACSACGKEKPGSLPKSSEASKPTTTFTFGIPQGVESKSTSFSAPSSTSFTFGVPSFSVSVTQKPGPDLFKSTTTSSDVSSPLQTSQNSPSPFTFGSGGGLFNFNVPSSAPNETTSVVPNTLSGKSGFDFSSPSQKNTHKSDFAFGSSTFHFAMAPSNVPASPGNSSQHDESGYDPEEEENHHQFQPVVPLPKKVDVVTGEEKENVLYCQRAKLFRYESDTKEWKERGLGDVKILQHKETGKIRFLMRREPVMKVCLNHFLTSDVEMREKDEKSWMWFAVDYSEGVQKNENFAIRFKSPDIAQAFKEEVDKAKLLPQTPDAVIQHELEEPKDEQSSGSDNDVEFVSELKPSPELVEKANSLMLPPNFYCYLDKRKCRGCRGCEPDDTEEDSEPTEKCDEKVTAVINSEEKKDSLFSTNLFGQVPLATSIFGNSETTPSNTSFSFAQAFIKAPSNNGKKTSDTPLGYLFKDQASFSSLVPQKNIFSAEGGQAFKWEGAGQPVFGSKTDKTISCTVKQVNENESEENESPGE